MRIDAQESGCVRPEIRGKFGDGGEVLALPQIADVVFRGWQSQVFPRVGQRLRRILQIKKRDIGALTCFRTGDPDCSGARVDYSSVIAGMLIDSDDFRIGEQRCGPIVEHGEIAAHD